MAVQVILRCFFESGSKALYYKGFKETKIVLDK